MSAPTAGGVTVKVLTGRTAASLQRYRDSTVEGQEPYLFSATRQCSHDVETQIAEWKAVREMHGTQGARRTQKATYETVDPETGLHASGRPGTHVKEYRSGRWRKRPVHVGEMPTHFRIEAGDLVAKASEAVHTIYAAAADLVNPDDPDDVESFFEAVKTEREAHYPGIQESMWLERNGKSGLVHVHVASNATICEDFRLHGVDYSAGRKMAGALTRVHDVRAAFEQFLDAHPEHGFTQSLARVGSQQYVDAQLRSGQKDYHDSSRGKESRQDRIRRQIVEALQAVRIGDRQSFVAEMKVRGIDVTETGLRRGKPGKNHDYAYRVDGATQAVRGRTLGVEYSYGAIGAQLASKALGQEIGPMGVRQHAGEAKPLLSAEVRSGLTQLRAYVDRLARAERDRVQPKPRSFADKLSDLRRELQELAASSPEPLAVDEAVARNDEVAKAATESQRAPRRRFVTQAPEPITEPQRPGAYRSGVRLLTHADPKGQAALQRFAAFDELWAERFRNGEKPDADFEREATALRVNRTVVGSLIGLHLHVLVRGHLCAREDAKDVSKRLLAAARVGDHEVYEANMARRDHVQKRIQRGQYEQAVAMTPYERETQSAMVTSARRQVSRSDYGG